MLKVKVAGLEGKMGIIEKSDRGSVTFKQLICAFMLCVMASICLNLVLLGIEKKVSSAEQSNWLMSGENLSLDTKI